VFSEEQLIKWTKPSSDTEKDKQTRAENRVKQAINNYAPFQELLLKNNIKVYGKGSYTNNTNVRLDSDVDIVVERTDSFNWAGIEPKLATYTGPWTRSLFREEVLKALQLEYGYSLVDQSGNIAYHIEKTDYTVNTDIVPCSSYRLYTDNDIFYKGTYIEGKDGKVTINYPKLQYENEVFKNEQTHGFYKNTVRVLKNIENYMVDNFILSDPIPSYFIESLAFNVSNAAYFTATENWTYTERVSNVRTLLDIDSAMQLMQNYKEPNLIKPLFGTEQLKWNEVTALNFTYALKEMGY
jgi:hypothetical protein